MSHFAPWPALGGGLLIGIAAFLLLFLNGRIAGVSNIAGGLWFSARGERAWRLLFIAGLLAGAGAWVRYRGAAPAPRPDFPAASLVLSGALVGYGTALARGCTSGHGVCGLARLSPRSLVATLTFLVVAIATTFVVRHVLHVA
jgi:uncharacterized protein